MDVHDMIAIMAKYNNACIVTGRKAPEHKLTLVRVSDNCEMGPNNAVPVCTTYARRHECLEKRYHERVKTE